MTTPTARQMRILRRFMGENRVPYAEIPDYMALRMRDWLKHDVYKSYWTLTPKARRELCKVWFVRDA